MSQGVVSITGGTDLSPSGPSKTAASSLRFGSYTARAERTYGVRRVYAELRARGASCGRHRIGRLMREAGLKARGPKRRTPKQISSAPLTPVAENVLDRAFGSDRPNRVWACDITYIQTGEGWLYLAVVIDLFSRRVVGWAMRPSLGRELAVSALRSALRDRRPPSGLLHHSDQGSQYTSSEYRALLRAHEVNCSMSRRGNCHDNAPAESFFGSFKTECVRGVRLQSHAQARTLIFDYLTFYNQRRRHSTRLPFTSRVRRAIFHSAGHKAICYRQPRCLTLNQVS